MISCNSFKIPLGSFNNSRELKSLFVRSRQNSFSSTLLKSRYFISKCFILVTSTACYTYRIMVGERYKGHSNFTNVLRFVCVNNVNEGVGFVDHSSRCQYYQGQVKFPKGMCPITSYFLQNGLC